MHVYLNISDSTPIQIAFLLILLIVVQCVVALLFVAYDIDYDFLAILSIIVIMSACISSLFIIVYA